MSRPSVFCIVLAGGEGKRLMPLTADRAKPAVPFGGHYRLIDFALSNLVNAGYFKIAVLTQYKSHSLDRHVSTTWRLSALLGNYVTPVPAQQRMGPHWFAGSADAIYQSLNLITDEEPDHVCVFGADHVYRMDPSQMVEEHVRSGAGMTIAAIGVPIKDAGEYGVIDSPDGRQIEAFHEKPERPVGLPDQPERVYASMGNYVFSAATLIDVVTRDAADEGSAHDVGKNIIPMLVEAGEASVYDFSHNDVPGATDRDRGYWRDVGTLDAYHESHMELLSAEPAFNLGNQRWPIRSWSEALPPAVFLGDESRAGLVTDSMVCAGSVVHGGVVRWSVLSPEVVVHPDARVEGSVLLHGVEVGEGAIIRNAIVDKNVVVPAGARIGVDLETDRKRFVVSAGGIVAIGKGQEVE
jgi:glucose-1-phosphate adenylyltransferase